MHVGSTAARTRRLLRCVLLRLTAQNTQLLNRNTETSRKAAAGRPALKACAHMHDTLDTVHVGNSTTPSVKEFSGCGREISGIGRTFRPRHVPRYTEPNPPRPTSSCSTSCDASTSISASASRSSSAGGWRPERLLLRLESLPLPADPASPPAAGASVKHSYRSVRRAVGAGAAASAGQVPQPAPGCAELARRATVGSCVGSEPRVWTRQLRYTDRNRCSSHSACTHRCVPLRGLQKQHNMTMHGQNLPPRPERLRIKRNAVAAL